MPIIREKGDLLKKNSEPIGARLLFNPPLIQEHFITWSSPFRWDVLLSFITFFRNRFSRDWSFACQQTSLSFSWRRNVARKNRPRNDLLCFAGWDVKPHSLTHYGTVYSIRMAVALLPLLVRPPGTVLRTLFALWTPPKLLSGAC